MAIENNIPRVQIVSAGQDTFSYTFKLFDENDVEVYVGTTLKTLTTDYSVTGVGEDDGGTIIFVSPVAEDEVVTIARVTARERETDYQQSGSFVASVVNTDFDRLWAVVQELEDAKDRTATAAVTTEGSINYTLPAPSADRVLKWNGDANGFVNSDFDPDVLGSAQASAVAAAAAAAASADAAATSAATINLPDVEAGTASKMLRVKGDETGYELRSPEQTRTDIDAAASIAAPVGMIIDYAGTTAPNGWLLCHGQAVSRATYAALFAVLGTTYGAGDGSTTFNVPDLRGRVIAGKDDMGGSSANRLTGNLSGGVNGDTLGATGGEEGHVQTVTEMASHNHGVNDPQHGHVIGTNDPAGGAGAWPFVGGARTGAASVGAGSASPNSTGISIQSNGSGAAANVVQPTMILNKIIYAAV